MDRIKLSKGTWLFDPNTPLGAPGGFGEVFAGQGDEGPVAVKRLKITAEAAAHREIQIGEELASRELRNVVPVLDYGQDSDSDRYFLIMPRCDYNLDEYLSSCRILNWSDAKLILLEIVSGLQEIEHIVHRDLKPSNILYHQGSWKVADFGIAKFVEDSTSSATLRKSLTPAYAAPEQWRGERPTMATDVYALGCIVHSMLNGAPPFVGDLDEIRDGHLSAEPPPVAGVNHRLEGIVRLMLRKVPMSRPTLTRVRDVISEITDVPPQKV